jgi:hypothetical protein
MTKIKHLPKTPLIISTAQIFFETTLLGHSLEFSYLKLGTLKSKCKTFSERQGIDFGKEASLTRFLLYLLIKKLVVL